MINKWVVSLLLATPISKINHGNVIKYTKRPFANVDEMNAELIRRWNNVVQPTDTVLHLGDLCFNKKDKDFNYWSSRLNGNKIFLQGNHDNHIDAPVQACIIKYGGLDWYCSHYPERRYKHNLCGHVHDLWRIQRTGHDAIINVGTDMWGYAPVSMADVLRLVQES